MGKDKRNVLILTLILIIVVLIGLTAYLLLIKPAVNGLVIEGQNQGIQYTVLSIAQQAATCQTVPLTVGNQSINLVAVECLPSGCLQPAQ